jgi:hypothetical protein
LSPDTDDDVADDNRIGRGPPGAPSFYLQDPTGKLFRISGPLNTSAALTEVDTGLQSVDALDPADPNIIYASDPRAGMMMVSRNSGTSWQPDTALTTLVTHSGQFPYRSLLGYPRELMFPLGMPGQPCAIAFDPTGQTIMVGTRTAGTFASSDQGAHWRLVPGSEQIPRPAGFFFDDRTGTIYVGSSGRGMWRIDIPQS